MKGFSKTSNPCVVFIKPLLSFACQFFNSWVNNISKSLLARSLFNEMFTLCSTFLVDISSGLIETDRDSIFCLLAIIFLASTFKSAKGRSAIVAFPLKLKRSTLLCI